ncbi:ABC transporter ATP-binding protein [Nocardioides endophyticus]|uniref:ABC transporter ATP-binding protein n=1 Tax=Nocardioides endophyticus TaxID=1353775 RepID=A0ABP8YTD1_9ACTN
MDEPMLMQPEAEISATRVESAEPASGPVVSITGVGKIFGTGEKAVSALEDVSFDVQPGSFVALLGPSGCGKSTLMRLMAGLQPVTSGSIDFEGRSPEQMRKAREFGIVFQQPILFDWRTVQKNVELPLELIGVSKAEARARADEMLSLVGLQDFATKRPWQLSGGMQQRVAIARALAFRPRFLMMDEPFGALDMMTRERMQVELLRIWDSKPDITVTFITHSISEAVLLADRVVVMSARPGRVMKVIDVDLERPRFDDIRQSKEFVDIEGEIRELIYSQEN